MSRAAPAGFVPYAGLLGWAILDEPLTPRMFAAAALVVGSVVAVTRSQGARR